MHRHISNLAIITYKCMYVYTQTYKYNLLSVFVCVYMVSGLAILHILILLPPVNICL